MGITSRVAEFALGVRGSDVPSIVTTRSVDMIVNAAAIGLAGSKTEAARILVDYIDQESGRPSCTVIGTGIRSFPAYAALANGTMVHVLDYDEIVLRRSNHPSNIIFPTVMALGEELRLSGNDVVEAFVIGCEVATKLGAAGELDQLLPTPAKLGWHLEGVTGVVGAAVATGRLLGLSQEEMECAIGISVSQAAGVQASYGTFTKSFHCGQAAMNGIVAAKLAARGYTAARDALENRFGLFSCYHRNSDVEEGAFVSALGNPFDVDEPGVGLKLYPCGSSTHSAIDTVLNLSRKYSVDPEAVARVEISCVPRAGIDMNNFAYPESGLQGKYSVHYVAAVALLYGPPRMEHFTDEAVRDERVRSLLDRITVINDEVPSMAAPRPCSVKLTLSGGEVLRHREVHASGHPANPLTAAQLDDKFAACARDVLDPSSVPPLVADLRRISDVADVSEVFRRLGRAS